MATSETPADSASAEAIDLSSTNPYSLHRTVHARRSEYVRRYRVRIKVGTWNVAACPGTDKDLARWFVNGEGLDPALGSSAPEDTRHDGSSAGDTPIELADSGKIGLYVLGLQEISDLSAPGQYMSWIYAADSTTVDKWKAALEAALPDGYQLVATEQLAGMLLLAYASPELAPTIGSISTTSVATGALGYLGNKGAVCARIVLGEVTQLLFVNSHLASGVEDYYLERRINQVQQITSQASFEPVVVAGVSEDDKTKIDDEDFAFWFGDLNFRLDRLPGDDIRRLLMLHTRGEYDLSKRELRRESSLEGEPIVVRRVSGSIDEVVDKKSGAVLEQQPADHTAANPEGTDDDSVALTDPDDFPVDPHEDPASLQSTLDSLLPHDQLRRLIKERKVMHDGWREGPISFMPTYKYDVGTVALFDSSEKRRPPSWCDRILYRTRADLEEYKRKTQEEDEARKKDEEMKARGVEEEAANDDVLFSYDPGNDGEDQPSSAGLDYDEYDDADDDGDDGKAPDHTGHDRIRLELYTSHQRITSSDHKPVSSIFTLDYDAVVPELKAKVHAEVARELDRTENEGRPGITIVVDHDAHHPTKPSDLGSSAHVDFGEVRFLRKEVASLTLANTGRVPATVSFVDKPVAENPEGDNTTQLQWLAISFVRPEPTVDHTESSVDLGKEVTLEPGETVNVELEALVSEIRHARVLNEGQATLEEVLILRVADGRDHFIPARASWAPTCIGRSVVELVCVPDGGIRSFAKALSEKRGRAGAIPSDLPIRQPVPKELFQLTDAIENLTQRALADAQMLQDCTIPKAAGWPFDEAACKSADADTQTSHIIALIDALDQDKPILSVFDAETPSHERLEAVSQALLLLLRGLTDGIIPASLWHLIEQAATSSSLPSLTHPSSSASNIHNTPPPADDSALDQDRTTILDILQSDPHHNIAFVFLTTTLARVVAELAPLSKAELDLIRPPQPRPASSSSSSTGSSGTGTGGGAVKSAGGGGGFGGVLAAATTGVMGRRGLGGFARRNTGSSSSASASMTAPVTEAWAAWGKRRARERRVAEIFAGVVCRDGDGAGTGVSAKERKAREERKRAVLELFLRRGVE